MGHAEYVKVAALDRYWAAQHRADGKAEAAQERETHAAEMEAMAAASAGSLSQEMPTYSDLYAFLRDEYLNSRFEGRNSEWPNGVTGGGTYSTLVANRYLSDLQKEGIARISHFESRRGRPVVFDRSLTILNPDAPVVEIQHRAGSLSAPMAGVW